MGSFLGHALPGSFFIGFATWWLYAIFRRYFEAKFSRRKFYNTASFRCSCVPHIPLEAYIKIILISIGVIGETVTGFRDGRFVNLGNGHHITMFSFFIFNAIIDLIYFHRPGLLPDGLDYLTAIIGFSVEGCLFSWHLHGRSEIDIQVHTFLYYAVICTIVFSMFEYFNRNTVLFGLGRSMGTLLQGTWFYQIGFSIHNPWGYNMENTHRQMMLVTMMFCWHLGAILVFTAIIGSLVYSSVCRRYPDVVITKRNRYDEEIASLELSDTEEETLLSSKNGEYSKLSTKEISS